MKCSQCGAKIPDGELYCKNCGAEVQIVGDYNPLEEVLANEVKGGIHKTGKLPLNEDRMEEEAVRKPNIRRKPPASKATEMSTSRADRERRRRAIEKKKEALKKKRIRAVIIALLFVVAFIVLIIVIYNNSYTGLYKKGQTALTNSEYEKAIDYFQRAIDKNDSKLDAIQGLANTYKEMGDLNKAEEVFLSAIEKHTGSVDLYTALIDFYISTSQHEKVTILLDNTKDANVKKQLQAFITARPEFSLPADVLYDEVQELTLTSSGVEIRFTTDDSPATLNSTVYAEPILLQEGENVIRAISINEKGIPSVEVRKVYNIELPMHDAPAVTPSTGQYEEPTMISVAVPEGFVAYYTMDGTDPTPQSNLYEKPIKMPDGNTYFSAILVDGNGRISDVTRRNYELIIQSAASAPTGEEPDTSTNTTENTDASSTE